MSSWVNGNAKSSGQVTVAVFGCLLAASLVALMIKNISLGSPIMAGDEYAYFAQAREFPSVDAIMAYDPTIQRTDNILYLWVGSLLWRNFADAASTMRLFQSALYLLILPFVFTLCRFFMSRLNSAVLTVIACYSALSSYTAYFMPETIYQLLFFMLAGLAVATIPEWPILSASACGFVVALIMLTKPHGVAIAVAVCMAFLAGVVCPQIFARTRTRSFVAFLVFGLATYVSMVGVNGTLTGQVQFSPLLFVGRFYRGVLTSSGVIPSWNLLYPVLLGNGIALAMLVGIPITCIGCGLWFVCRQPLAGTALNGYTLRRARFTVLAVLAISALVFSVIMTVRFTTELGGSEIWRIYGRYYSFTIALCIATMGISGTIWRGEGGEIPAPISLALRGAAVLGILVLMAVQFWWRAAFAIAPWDFPEIWSFTLNDFIGGRATIGTALVIIGCLCFVGTLFRPVLSVGFFLTFFAALDAASLIQVTRWQFAHGRAFAPYSQPAFALHTLLAGPTLDRGVIIGPDRGMLTYTLFNLRSRSRVLLLPQRSVLSQGMVASDVDWVLTEGPYDIQLAGRTIVKTERLTLIAVHPVPPFLP
jgi:phosphoglycerol transferase